ncbi:MAG: hypothetical protein U0903_17900 [Planctomycetales bacterium]
MNAIQDRFQLFDDLRVLHHGTHAEERFPFIFPDDKPERFRLREERVFMPRGNLVHCRQTGQNGRSLGDVSGQWGSFSYAGRLPFQNFEPFFQGFDIAAYNEGFAFNQRGNRGQPGTVVMLMGPSMDFDSIAGLLNLRSFRKDETLQMTGGKFRMDDHDPLVLAVAGTIKRESLHIHEGIHPDEALDQGEKMGFKLGVPT